MIDAWVYPVWYRIAAPIAAFCHKRKITAITISAAGLVAAALAAGAILLEFYWFALALLLISRLADGLDGPVARLQSKSHPVGALLDQVCDFFCYGAIVAAFALTRDANQLAGVVLLFSFYLSGGSFLALAALTAQHPELAATAKGHKQAKGFFYSRGLMEGSETVAFFIAFMLFPDWFPILAYLFSLLCLLTVGLRVYQLLR